MMTLLRLTGAVFVAALPIDDSRLRVLRLKQRKKHRFADKEEALLFFDLLENQKNDAQVIKPFNRNYKEASRNTVSSMKMSEKSGEKTIECNPRADTQPDVGILSCGADSYCVESKDSALGGVCSYLTKQRGLDQNQSLGFAIFAYICSGYVTVEDFGFKSCDCSQLVDGVGPISCNIYDRYCFDVAENYCASVTVGGEVSFD